MSILINPRRGILLAGLLIISCIWAVAASPCPATNLTVKPSGVTISNPGALTPGMAVTMQVRVDFPTNGITTYPENNHLELGTNLEHPLWTWHIVRNGVKKSETEERKPRVVIGGDVLSYPENTAESLVITLDGTAPDSPGMENRTILKIQDFTSRECTSAPVYQYNVFIINTTVHNRTISHLATEIADLRTGAETKNRAGADTAPVMRKIGDAQQSLDTANATSPLEYASLAFAINNTETAIAEAKRLLNEQPAMTPAREPSGAAGSQNATQASPVETTVKSPLSLPVFVVMAACAGAVMIRKRGT